MTDDAPRLSHADAARTIVQRGREAALSTLSAKHPGHPFASAVTYALTPDGEPLLLISTLATHSGNLTADPRATLLVVDTSYTTDPLASGRVSLMGSFTVDPEEAHREAMLEQRPETAVYIDFADFSLYRMRVERVRYIGGFGRMSWLSGDAYRQATPDPLAQSADDIITHMNEDHADALLLYCRAFGGMNSVSAATLIGVDHLGYDIEAYAEERRHALRLPFDAPATTPGEVRGELVRLVRRAREQLGEEGA